MGTNPRIPQRHGFHIQEEAELELIDDPLEYDKWEYDIKDPHTLRRWDRETLKRYLNAMGRAGWELLSFDDLFMIFKRRKKIGKLGED